MAIFATNPLPILEIVFYSAMVIVAMFIIKLMISDRMLRKIITERPYILFMGIPNAGKMESMQCLTKSKVKTRVLPFIGRFRLSDFVFKDKEFRALLFHSVSNEGELKPDALRMLSKKPKAIVFVVKRYSDDKRIEEQRNMVLIVKEMMPDIPIIVAMNHALGSNRKVVKHMKMMLGDCVMKHAICDHEGIAELKRKLSAELWK